MPPVHQRMCPHPGAQLVPRSAPDINLAIITATILGYLLIGIANYVLYNKGRIAGRPDWYLDGERGSKQKTTLALWYIVVILFWPLALPWWMTTRCGHSCIEEASEPQRNRNTTETRGVRRGVDLPRRQYPLL